MGVQILLDGYQIPGTTGHPEWDALLAGLVIDTCVKASTQPPQWSTKQRPLSQPWSPLGPPARGAQPLNPHLAELGVIVTERDLVTD